MKPLKLAVSRCPIVMFLCVTFSFSWGFAGLLYGVTGNDVFFIVGAPFAWGPLVGGVVTVWLLDENVRSWIGQIRNWRVGGVWYGIGIGVLLLRTDFNGITAFLLGTEVTLEASGWMLYTALFNFFVTLILAGALEEFGWRGFAQARLQQRYNAALVTVFIGGIWAVWHAPLILLGLGSFTTPFNYALILIGTSVFYGWLYNETDGGLFVVMVAHAAGNMPAFIRVTGGTPHLLESLPITPTVLFSLTFAGVLIWYAGSETLTRDGILPDVPGHSG
ncbi:membrane protease YdiL (CAAX protease family) [Halorubrum alkaliphilum]|uniref:Membrane protease YdiL (CAAX protease family) n=2 Tax=Halorubrum alkaliphilum TaxID=261290 RepID=A0A8T4GCW7_9EURY|nr:membrane protease YdiL (CAAX protease family) [Halorubrum alkaliphilum]